MLNTLKYKSFFKEETESCQYWRNKKPEINESMDAPPAITHPTNQPKPNNIINQDQLYNAYVVAATLYGEARGEGEAGMQAVLNVIMNRAKQDFDKAKDVVMRPKQFSMWNNVSNPEKASIELAKREKNNQVYRNAIKLVDLAMKNKLPDITGGATFYFNPKKANPSWANKLVKTKEIGNHKFYKVPKQLKEEQQTKSGNISTTSYGLVDDGMYGYEITSPYSYLRYRHEPSTNIFYFDNVGTSKDEDKHKGYAKELMEVFFKLVKDKNGAVDMGAYTTSGTMYVKPVAERFAKQYNVRLVTGRKYD